MSLHATGVTRWGWYTMVVEHDLTTPDGRAASPPGFAPSPHGTMHDGLQPAGLRLAR